MDGWTWVQTAGDQVDWDEAAAIEDWIDAGAPPVEEGETAPPVEQGETAPPLPSTAKAVEVPAVALAVSREQAAALLSISVDSFERHVLPALRVVQLGRRQLIPVRELEAFMSSHAARALK